MKEVVVSVREEDFDRLQSLATELGMAPGELARLGLEDLLGQPDEALRKAISTVIEKNQELYRRLA